VITAPVSRGLSTAEDFHPVVDDRMTEGCERQFEWRPFLPRLFYLGWSP